MLYVTLVYDWSYNCSTFHKHITKALGNGMLMLTLPLKVGHVLQSSYVVSRKSSSWL
jgi:hypothetical protein